MPNNLRIIENNLTGTTGTVTVSSALPTLPGTNLVRANRKKVWRTQTGTWTATAVFDLGTAYPVTCFALISSNLTDTGTITVQGNAADSWTAPSFSSGALACYDNDYTGVLLWYWASQSYRYWRAILDDPDNTNDYLEAGVAWLGTYVSIERNLVYGWDEEVVPLSRISYGDDGIPYVDEMSSYKTISMDIRFLSETWARLTLMPILKRVVGKKDIILALFPERTAAEGTAIEHGANYYGKIMTARILNNSYQRYQWPGITFRES